MKQAAIPAKPLQGGSGDDLLSGTTGDDYLYGAGGHDTLLGGDGDDKLSAGQVYINGAWQPDPKGDRLDGGNGNDLLYGELGDDTLLGGSGNDYLSGAGGNDSLVGGSGVDTMFGDAGNDTLVGSVNGGYLSGGDRNKSKGDGNDLFIINSRYTTIATNGEAGDRGIINVDWFKATASVTQWEWAPGVQKLPYWLDALTQPLSAWLAADNATHVIKYSFPQLLPADFTSRDSSGFTPFSAEEILYTRRAFDYLSSVVNVKFEETATPGDFAIVLANNDQKDSSGYASMVWGEYSAHVLLDLKPELLSPSLDKGHKLYWALMHELGHALGLKHPFSHPDADGNVGVGPYLPDAEDKHSVTLMSYTDDTNATASATMAPLDIAALQYLWGVAPGANAGNTVHKLDAYQYNFIYDGGGIDAIDGSSLWQDMVVDLRPGYWSYIGQKSTLITANGQVTINLGTQIESLIGGSGNDTLTGNDANNALMGGRGNDRLDGGAGLDVTYYGGPRAGYTLALKDGALLVSDKDGYSGNDTLVNIERLHFSDVNVALDTNGAGASIYRLYQAAFDRTPDQQGLGFWLDASDRGMGLVPIARGFMQSPEFKKLYGEDVNDVAFIKSLYHNALHREYDEGGLNFWLDAIKNGTSRESILHGFANSQENIANIAEVIGLGFDYIPYTG